MSFTIESHSNRVLEECDSTNDVAKSLASQGASHGTWVSAKRQLCGRGRLGRKWESLEGNLFLSLIVRDLPLSLWSWIPLASAIGVQRSINAIFPEIQIRIKWPNDLWADQGDLGRAKLGGILCEGVAGTSDLPYVVVGIGLNCLWVPKDLNQSCTSLTQVRQEVRVSADDVRLKVKDAVLESLLDLRVAGVERIAQDYSEVSLFQPGTEVRWGKALEKGRVVGLGALAELQIRLDSGETKSLYAEDVHFFATVGHGSDNIL